ncbi:class I SAM-dependent methyltransferase [Paenibacillus campinasensis]|uniref:Methyltransferase domain-containing protein n=1 Tax=Paenibacillus campinasensis TaxID=66347 RepID=A0A268EYZ4_9BACL|nr:class I SAM-dependent methyltransferase [Paenibacillus campinasensis]PAD78294.1 hypothetical protein CHH67_07130 [Paenibacillus campinasensis]
MLDRLEDFFKEDYLLLSQAIMTPERTAAEIQHILDWLSLDQGASILDLGCGYGRLSIPLAQMGYRVTGLDYSEVSLIRAKEEAAGLTGADIEFVRGLMKDLDGSEIYDAALNIGTAIGYLEEEDDYAAFRRVFKALKTGGTFLVETENRDFKIAGYTPRRWDDMNGVPVWSERRYYPSSGRWVEKIRWFRDRNIHSSVLDVRLYSATELTRMLTEAGFRDVRVYGSLDRKPLELTSPRMVLSAIKP